MERFIHKIQLLLLLLSCCCPALAIKDLLTFLDDPPPLEPCIDYKNASCQLVKVHFEAAKNEEHLRFPGGSVKRRTNPGAGYNNNGKLALRFEGDDYDLSVLIISEEDGQESLTAKLHDSSWDDEYAVRVVNCGPDCHVLLKNAKSEEGLSDANVNRLWKISSSMKRLQKKPVRNRARNRGLDLDQEPELEYISLMCYYSDTYATRLKKPLDEIEADIEETNYVMEYNELPMRFYCLCTGEIKGLKDSHALVEQRQNQNFEYFGNWRNLTKTADIAVTFYYFECRYAICGAATYINAVPDHGIPHVIVSHTCESENNDYTLVHEIGHILGARHNIEKDETPGSSHGYLIPNTNGRTMMGRKRGKHKKRIPFFSTPFTDEYYNYKGQPIGNEETANARQQLLDVYKVYVDFGDESAPCGESCADWPFLDCQDFAENMAPCDDPVEGFGTRFHCPLTCGTCTCDPDEHKELCRLMYLQGLCSEAQEVCPTSCGCHY